MKRTALSLLMLSLALTASAQTNSASATFTFGPPQQGSNNLSITAWNGVVNAYPLEMGYVQLTTTSVCGAVMFSDQELGGIDAPFQLGFPNGGFLVDQGQFVWSKPSCNGGASAVSGTLVMEGYPVTINVVLNFSVTTTRVCYRGRCISYNVAVATGGSGVVAVQ